MSAARIATSLRIAAGLLLGYLLWLAGGALVAFVFPVRWWVPAGALLLAVFTVLALTVAHRVPNNTTATILRWSPLPAVLASAYVVAVALV